MSDLGGFGLKVIREALENLVEQGLASTVVLEALGRLPDDQDLPQTAEALHGFVDGPLSSTLRRHLGASSADVTIKGVSRILGTALRSRSEAARVPGRRRRGPSQKSTSAIASTSGTMKLLVVARTQKLVRKIEAALGSARISAIAVDNLEEVWKYAQQLDPNVVILDGQDAADIAAVELADVFAQPSDRLLVLWAMDQPWGNSLHRVLSGRNVDLTPIPRSAGLESLLDHLRARSD